MSKVILFGLDGANFDFLTPLFQRGELPNLKKLIDDGISCNLESVIPPWTAPAWVSLYCGKNPGKHGVFDFFKYRAENYELTLNTSMDIHSRLIWDYLSENDLFSIVVNAPLTYPTHKINGVIIPGYLAPENPICYPKGILKEVKKEVGDYRVYSKYELDPKVDTNALLKDYVELVKMRRDASLYLMKRYNWDFMMVQFQKTDSIFHDIEFRLVKDKINLDKVAFLYKKVDQAIGEILSYLKKEVNVLVVSDHGIKMYDGWDFHPNTWLKNEGLITTTKNRTEFQFHDSKRDLIRYKSKNETKILERLIKMSGNLGLTVQKIEKILSFFKLDAFFKDHITPDLISLFQSENVDWRNSLAFCRSKTDWGIRLNVKDAISEKLIEEIVTKLRKVKDPEGKQVFESVRLREEVYKGNWIGNAPNIVFKPKMSYRVASTRIRNKMFFRKSSMINHDMHGILIASGPDFKSCKLNESRPSARAPNLMDIAPTILCLLKVPIDKDMDGRVLFEFFNNEKKFILKKYATRGKKRTKIGKNEKEIIERLKILGYV